MRFLGSILWWLADVLEHVPATLYCWAAMCWRVKGRVEVRDAKGGGA